MNIEDFLPTYPGYPGEENQELFSIYGDEELTSVIQKKKEFLELTLEREERPTGDLLRHQRFIQRFMSGHTPYNGILLWHAVGTGKTGSAIAIAEGIKNFNESFQKALLLVRSNTFIRNFKNELAYERTGGAYLPPNIASLTAGERTRRINKRISEYYEFNTFQVFGKEFRDSTNKQRLINYYSNRVIIIDEVHNIRRTKSGTYDAIHEFLHSVKNAKIILLTATPIKDKASEFADIMNLILPLNQQLPIGTDFMNSVFSNWNANTTEELLHDLEVNEEFVKDPFIESIKGRVSYLQPVSSDVQIVQVGQTFGDAPFPQVRLEMSKLQTEVFGPIYDEEIKRKIPDSDEDLENEDDSKEEKLVDGMDRGSTLYTKSIKSSLCVSRSETTGKSFSRELMLDEMKRANPDNTKLDALEIYKAKLDILQEYSCKYHYIVRHILQHKKHNSFVYCIDVKKQGIDTLEKVLQQFGFSPAAGEINTIGKRYAIITGQTPEGYTEAVLNRFNQLDNAEGDYIQVVIGSAAIGEGRSLLSVRDIFIATPHWNLTDMDQAIGRGIRFGSHRFLKPEDKIVSIHRLRAVIPSGVSGVSGKSIDGYITGIAYTKDILSKRIESIARAAAIDCEFNYERNRPPPEVDNDSRQCLYQECEYSCAVPREADEKTIEDTYNLFYTEKEYQAIKNHFRSLFSRNFQYLLSDVLRHRELTVYSRIVVLRSITSIIERHEIFNNPLGFPNYMKEKEGLLFLVNDATATADPYHLYDAKLGQKYPQIRFETFLQQYMIQNLDSIINKIKRLLRERDQLVEEGRELRDQASAEIVGQKKATLLDRVRERKTRAKFAMNSANQLFSSLTETIRLELLRYAIEHSSEDTPIIIFVKEQMTGFYEDLDGDIRVSKLNEKFVDGRWETLESFSVENFRTRFEASKLSYYGIMDGRQFKLIQYKQGATTGQLASTINLDKLQQILNATFAVCEEKFTEQERARRGIEGIDKMDKSNKATIIDKIRVMLDALHFILDKDQNEQVVKK